MGDENQNPGEEEIEETSGGEEATEGLDNPTDDPGVLAEGVEALQDEIVEAPTSSELIDEATEKGIGEMFKSIFKSDIGKALAMVAGAGAIAVAGYYAVKKLATYVSDKVRNFFGMKTSAEKALENTQDGTLVSILKLVLGGAAVASVPVMYEVFKGKIGSEEFWTVFKNDGVEGVTEWLYEKAKEGVIDIASDTWGPIATALGVKEAAQKKMEVAKDKVKGVDKDDAVDKVKKTGKKMGGGGVLSDAVEDDDVLLAQMTPDDLLEPDTMTDAGGGMIDVDKNDDEEKKDEGGDEEPEEDKPEEKKEEGGEEALSDDEKNEILAKYGEKTQEEELELSRHEYDEITETRLTNISGLMNKHSYRILREYIYEEDRNLRSDLPFNNALTNIHSLEEDGDLDSSDMFDTIFWLYTNEGWELVQDAGLMVPTLGFSVIQKWFEANKDLIVETFKDFVAGEPNFEDYTQFMKNFVVAVFWSSVVMTIVDKGVTGKSWKTVLKANFHPKNIIEIFKNPKKTVVGALKLPQKIITFHAVKTGQMMGWLGVHNDTLALWDADGKRLFNMYRIVGNHFKEIPKVFKEAFNSKTWSDFELEGKKLDDQIKNFTEDSTVTNNDRKAVLTEYDDAVRQELSDYKGAKEKIVADGESSGKSAKEIKAELENLKTGYWDRIRSIYYQRIVLTNHLDTDFVNSASKLDDAFKVDQKMLDEYSLNHMVDENTKISSGAITDYKLDTTFKAGKSSDNTSKTPKPETEDSTKVEEPKVEAKKVAGFDIKSSDEFIDLDDDKKVQHLEEMETKINELDEAKNAEMDKYQDEVLSARGKTKAETLDPADAIDQKYDPDIKALMEARIAHINSLDPEFLAEKKISVDMDLCKIYDVDTGKVKAEVPRMEAGKIIVPEVNIKLH